MNTRTLTGSAGPWYREPWPWILIALPLSAVIAGFITLIIAIENPDGLVAEDYYKQGLAINRVLERESHAEELGLGAQVMISEEKVRVGLSGSATTRPGSITVRLIHPTRSGMDRSIKLNPIADGWYEGALPIMTSGRWRVQVEDDQATWRLNGIWMTSERMFTLPPAGAIQ